MPPKSLNKKINNDMNNKANNIKKQLQHIKSIREICYIVNLCKT